MESPLEENSCGGSMSCSTTSVSVASTGSEATSPAKQLVACSASASSIINSPNAGTSATASNSGGPTGVGGVLNPLNRADAVRRQSIEVVQLAKSDVEELHAKLKSLQEVLTKGEREKLQLESQIGTLRAQLALKGGATAAELLDALLALVQAGSTGNGSALPDDGQHLQQAGDSDIVSARTASFSRKLNLLVSLCSPSSNTPASSAGSTPNASAAVKRCESSGESSHNGLVERLVEKETEMDVGTINNVEDTKNSNNTNADIEDLKTTVAVSRVASSSVEQCSAITDRFQEKINKQQETIERLNNALEEVELDLEESHAKNAALQERLVCLEREAKQLRENQVCPIGNSDTGKDVEGEGDCLQTLRKNVLADDLPDLADTCEATRDHTKEPSSSTDVTTSTNSNVVGGASNLSEAASKDEELTRLRSDLEASSCREADLLARCADFSHQIENLTSQLAELTSQSGSSGLTGAAGAGPSVEAVQRENQNLMLELSEVQHTLNRLEGENERLKSSIATQCEEERRLARVDVTAAEAARDQAQADLVAANLAKEQAESALMALEAQNNSALADVERLQCDLQQAKTSASDAAKAANEELEKLKAKLICCEEERTKFSEEKMLLEERVQKLKSDVEERTLQNDEIEKKLKQYKEDIRKREDTINSHIDQITKHDDEIRCYKEKLNLLEEEDRQSKARLSEFESEKSSFLEQICKLKENSASLERKLEEFISEADVQMDLEFKNLEIEKSKLAEAMRVFEETKESLAASQAALKEKTEKLESERLGLDKERQLIRSEEHAKAKDAVASELESKVEEISSLKARLSEAWVQKEDHLSELKCQKEKLDAVRKELSASNEAKTRNEQLLRNLEARIEELETENATLKNNQECLAPPSLEVEMLLEELKSDLSISRSALEESNCKLALKNERVEKLEEQLSALCADRDKCKQTVNQVTAKLEALQHQFKESTIREQNAAESIRELRQRLDAALEQSRSFEESASNETARAQKLSTQLEEVKNDLNFKVEELRLLAAAMDEEKNRSEELVRKLEETNSMLEEHESNQRIYETVRGELAEARSRITAAEAAHDDTRAKLHHATEENSRIMHELKAMDEEKTSLHVDLVKCRQQLCETTQIKSSLEKLRTENAELRSNVEKTRADCERALTDGVEQKASAERFASELANVRQEATAAAVAVAREKEALMSEIAALSEKHLKVKSELETIRAERTEKADLAAELGKQLAVVLAKAKETRQEREVQDRQLASLRAEVGEKIGQLDKLGKDLRTATAHSDNLKKQVSKLVLAVAEKEKHIAGLHCDNQNLRAENHAYCEKLAGQDALINRIAALEQDIVSRNITISKVCAEREDGVRQLEQLRVKHAQTLRDIETETQAKARLASERQALAERLSSTISQHDELKKQHDIVLNERTIAETRYRSTLSVLRKVEKEMVTLQKDKERITNRLTEAQEHVALLERDRVQIVDACNNMPRQIQELQTENSMLKMQVEQLTDKQQKWKPLVQAALSGRAQASAAPIADSLGNSQRKRSVAPKKSIIARPENGPKEQKFCTSSAEPTSSSLDSELISPAKPNDVVSSGSAKAVTCQNVPAADVSLSSLANPSMVVLPSITTTAPSAAASAVSTAPSVASPAGQAVASAGSVQRQRRAIRRSAGEAELSPSGPPSKRSASDASCPVALPATTTVPATRHGAVITPTGPTPSTPAAATIKTEASPASLAGTLTSGPAIGAKDTRISMSSGAAGSSLRGNAASSSSASNVPTSTTKSASRTTPKSHSGRLKSTSALGDVKDTDKTKADEKEVTPTAPPPRRRSQQGTASTTVDSLSPAPCAKRSTPFRRGSSVPVTSKSSSKALPNTGNTHPPAASGGCSGANSSERVGSGVGSSGGSKVRSSADRSSGTKSFAANNAAKSSPTSTPLSRGRRSLIKGIPKKALAAISAGGTPTDGVDNRSLAAGGGAGGRSLRASTLVVKKASDIVAKQREQFKQKGRLSTHLE